MCTELKPLESIIEVPSSPNTGLPRIDPSIPGEAAGKNSSKRQRSQEKLRRQ